MDLNLPEKRVFIGPANFWKRLLALLVDLIILDFMVVGSFRAVMMAIAGDATDVVATYRMMMSSSSVIQLLSMIFMLIILLVMTYFVLLQYATGQTLGCILLNIHIVHRISDKEFERPKFWQCIVRNLFLIPVFPVILIWIADPVYMVFAKKGQRLTEWLSQTMVVERYEL